MSKNNWFLSESRFTRFSGYARCAKKYPVYLLILKILLPTAAQIGWPAIQHFSYQLLFRFTPRGGYILEDEHLTYPFRSAIIKTCFICKALRVFESAEDDVQYGQVSIIVPVQATPVVHAVALGPLYKIAYPAGRFNISMLKNAEKGKYQQRDSCSLRRQAHNEYETDTAYHCKTDSVHGAGIECGWHIQPLGTMVHLVKCLPQYIRPVHGPVPEV